MREILGSLCDCLFELYACECDCCLQLGEREREREREREEIYKTLNKRQDDGEIQSLKKSFSHNEESCVCVPMRVPDCVF